ncbi:hypothetical protein Tsubulata_033715 [Turnera subulata]|uniref:Uncharacterized protein n=1 Tax=Turnera subulata TaxID=218843 RepID=A0A9Q0JHZ7_9ROSI|nr:hypothetical protein Tsubulata_033715 [Turnera subulata]
MSEKEVAERSSKKQIRQPPSVPFVWEEKPGIAKKNWKPEVSRALPAVPTPVKLIASVPFNWEEKPGKPLSCFSQTQEETSLPTPSKELIIHQKDDDHKHYNDGGGEINISEQEGMLDGGEINISKQEGMLKVYLESFSFETDDSFTSTPSLMANCLVSSKAISTAVPAQDYFSRDDNDMWESPMSPVSETESSTSSYATGISSLAGSAFLECLFPLYTPGSGFPGKAASYQKESLPQQEQNPNYIDLDRNSSVVIRRPTTLGELIMMSRRRSYQRKAAQMRKQNLSMVKAHDFLLSQSELINDRASGCCIFGASIKMIPGMQAKFRVPRLKMK